MEGTVGIRIFRDWWSPPRGDRAGPVRRRLAFSGPCYTAASHALGGIDVGGTFTDVVVYDGAAGTWSLGKVPSTPADPTRGVLDALAKLGVESGTTARIVHGMTIGTNAILEKKGTEVWVLTSAGSRDCLEIQRTNRTTLYDIKTLKPPSLVARQHVLELDEGDVRSAVSAIDGTAGAVAVCLLHST